MILSAILKNFTFFSPFHVTLGVLNTREGVFFWWRRERFLSKASKRRGGGSIKKKGPCNFCDVQLVRRLTCPTIHDIKQSHLSDIPLV